MLPTKEFAYKHELKASLGYDSTLRVTQLSDVCKVTYNQFIQPFIQQWYQDGPKNELYESLIHCIHAKNEIQSILIADKENDSMSCSGSQEI